MVIGDVTRICGLNFVEVTEGEWKTLDNEKSALFFSKAFPGFPRRYYRKLEGDSNGKN